MNHSSLLLIMMVSCISCTITSIWYLLFHEHYLSTFSLKPVAMRLLTTFGNLLCSPLFASLIIWVTKVHSSIRIPHLTLSQSCEKDWGLEDICDVSIHHCVGYRTMLINIRLAPWVCRMKFEIGSFLFKCIKVSSF